jgi:hypothetical protein
MKLGKLLAAGKSIMNGRADVSYRSSKQIYLPKFGSSKNPFKTEAPVQTESSASASALPGESRAGATRLAGDAAGSAFNGESQLSGRPQIENTGRVQDSSQEQSRKPFGVSPGNALQRQASPGEAASPVPGRAGATHLAPRFTGSTPQKDGKDWSKFNPLSILRAALPSGKAGQPDNNAKFQKGTATQTELSLDSVKVVHNDLSDVDVEVVPIKSRAGVPELPVPKKSWEFVGERLFGVEAT